MKALVSIFMIIGFLSLLGCQPKTEPERNALESAEFFKDINALPVQEAQETQESQGHSPDEMQASPENPQSGFEDQSAMPSASEKPSIQDIQSALKNASLYEGKIDGLMGPKTRKAIEDFQEQNGLNVDGKVGPKTWTKLKPYFESPSQDNSTSGEMAASQQAGASAESTGIGD